MTTPIQKTSKQRSRRAIFFGTPEENKRYIHWISRPKIALATITAAIALNERVAWGERFIIPQANEKRKAIAPGLLVFFIFSPPLSTFYHHILYFLSIKKNKRMCLRLFFAVHFPVRKLICYQNDKECQQG